MPARVEHAMPTNAHFFGIAQLGRHSHHRVREVVQRSRIVRVGLIGHFEKPVFYQLMIVCVLFIFQLI